MHKLKQKSLLTVTVLLLAAACNRQQTMQQIPTPNKALNSTTPQPNLSIQPSGQSQPKNETANWKVYSDTQLGFQFKYPANWYNDGSYFSPQPIEYLEIGSVKAPVSYTTIKADKITSSNIQYQIGNSKRNQPDSAVTIAGKVFKKYDLQDYGRYEGDSAGRILILLSPELSLKGEIYYLAFQWQEKPALSVISGNDPAIFEQMVSTLELK